MDGGAAYPQARHGAGGAYHEAAPAQDYHHGQDFIAPVQYQSVVHHGNGGQARYDPLPLTDSTLQYATIIRSGLVGSFILVLV